MQLLSQVFYWAARAGRGVLHDLSMTGARIEARVQVKATFHALETLTVQ